MIPKINTGNGFRGVLEYNLQPHKGEIIGHDAIVGQDPRSLAHEFGVIRRMNQRVKQPVFHVSLSLAEGEHLSNEQWMAIARRYMHQMGFTNNQAVYIRHRDTKHEHVHVVANRVRIDDLKVVNNWKSQQRAQQIARVIERDHGLKGPDPSKKKEPRAKAPTRDELAMAERTKEPSSKMMLQMILDAAMHGKPSMTEFVQRLETHGVSVYANIASTGRVSGLAFEYKGLKAKGSKLGRAYGWSKLIRKVSYEQIRDLEVLCAATERAKKGETSQGSDGTGVKPVQERRERLGENQRLSPAIPTTPVQKRPDRRGKARSEPRSEPKPTRKTSPPNAGPHQPDPFSEHDFLRKQSAPIDPPVGDERKSQPRPEKKKSWRDRVKARVGLDPTARVVKRQLKGMSAECYEIGILYHRDTPQSRMNRRNWTREQILEHLPWLKRENARGADIFIRPDDMRWILVDDVSKQDIDRMKREGVPPSVVVETSLNNHQAWVRFPDQPTSERVATSIARALARRFNGDPYSADWRHMGRLAGFTNRKEEHKKRDGHHPFVLLHEYREKIAHKGQRFTDVAEQEHRQARLHARNSLAPSDLIVPVKQKQLPRKKTGEVDYSRVDYRLARDMARAGYETSQIVDELQHSPNLADRKGRNTLGYLTRTAIKATKSVGRMTGRVRDQDKEDQDQEKKKRRFLVSAKEDAPRSVRASSCGGSS